MRPILFNFCWWFFSCYFVTPLAVREGKSDWRWKGEKGTEATANVRCSQTRCELKIFSIWISHTNKCSGFFRSQLRSDVKAPADVPKSKNIDAYLSFEVCKSCHTYKRRATERFTEIAELLPKKNLELLINEHGPPRRGAFEISVLRTKDDTSDATLIWSGLKKGPPRRLKFPETKDIIELVTKAVWVQSLACSACAPNYPSSVYMLNL